jgi:hypothetical protein
MASTYVNDLRLNEMATGDASGSWGTVTNTNLELIGEAFSYGTETIGDADSTLTIADGAADAARSFYLKITSSVDLTTTRIVTLAPNTVSKVWMIENATTGSQVITIKQGSGATINVPNGQVKMISTDGAGSGGAVLDLLVDVDLTGTTTAVNLDVSGTLGVTGVLTTTAATVSNGGGQFNGAINVGIDDTGYDVKFFGATAGAYMLWDESADDLILGGAAGLSVNSAALVTGVLTTTAATVFNGGFVSNAASTISTADNLDTLSLISTDADANAAPNLRMYRNSESPADNDILGVIDFEGRNDNSQDVIYVNITAQANDVSNGSEDGSYYISTMFGGTLRNRMNVLPTETVFNQESLDLDFRVESDTDANALFVQGSDGFVGIGTTTSLSKLTALGTSSTVANGASTRNPVASFRGGNDNNRFEVYVDNSGATAIMGLGAYNSAGGNTDMAFYTGSTVAETMRIDSSGNVSIGTSSPASDTANERILQVNAPTTFSTLSLSTSRESTSGETIGKLSFDVLNNTATYRSRAQITTQSAGSTANKYGADMMFFTASDNTTDAAERMRIDSSGNIIIANTGGTLYTTTAGTSNFRAGVNAGNSIASGGIENVFVGDEAGTAITTGDYNTAVGYKALYSDTLGNRSVAIGREALLNQNFTSDTNAYNIAVGYGAGLTNATGVQNTNLGGFSGYYGTTADNSTFVGYAAGFGNDGSHLTGNNNTAIGSQAGSDLQGGAADNTFVGFDAGKSLTTATQNTHVGALSAGSGVVTGTRNNTFGYLAGQNLTSGTNNVFMGSYSGKAFTTGVSNTICGEAALITEDAGDKNTAIGAEALKVQTGGIDGNVAVGYYAGFALTSGSYNTIIGTEAMSLNAITGEQNVAVGYRAGKNITTGAGNVLIGKYAGADTTLLTTGSNNVVIGPLAKTSSASVNNEIVIGYNVAGSGEGYAAIGNGNGKISVDFEANATWSYSSDERLKKDIVADDLGLSFINRLETVKYKWKPSNEIDESLPQYAEENTRKTNVVMHGMVAQTVKAALDAENVDTFAGWSTDLDGTQMVSREMFVTPLIKAVQELSAKNDALEARLAVLEG